MLPKEHGYNGEMMREMDLSEISEEEIQALFAEYVGEYGNHLLNASQRRYFETFQRGLLSDLDRKSIEPIALEYLEEKDVRGFQQFFVRSIMPDAEIQTRYQELLAESICAPEGFLSVDDSGFIKLILSRCFVQQQKRCGAQLALHLWGFYALKDLTAANTGVECVAPIGGQRVIFKTSAFGEYHAQNDHAPA